MIPMTLLCPECGHKVNSYDGEVCPNGHGPMVPVNPEAERPTSE